MQLMVLLPLMVVEPSLSTETTRVFEVVEVAAFSLQLLLLLLLLFYVVELLHAFSLLLLLL